MWLFIGMNIRYVYLYYYLMIFLYIRVNVLYLEDVYFRYDKF